VPRLVDQVAAVGQRKEHEGWQDDGLSDLSSMAQPGIGQEGQVEMSQEGQADLRTWGEG
jgi:hypothetical protein